MMVRNIASTAVQMQQESMETEAAVRVTQKALDVARLEGEALLKMLDVQSEIYAHLGKNITTLA